MTVDPTTTRTDLEGKVLPELQRIAESLGVAGHQRLRKADLIDAIVASMDGRGNGQTSEPAEAGVASDSAADNGQASEAKGATAVAAEAPGQESAGDEAQAAATASGQERQGDREAGRDGQDRLGGQSG